MISDIQKYKSKHVYVVVVAAGQGLRLKKSIMQRNDHKLLYNSCLPKPYQPIGNLCLLEMTINNLLKHPDITVKNIQIVIHPDHQEYYDQLIGLPCDLPPPCYGGGSRLVSVYNGVRHISELLIQSNIQKTDVKILVHDAVRPNFSVSLISRLLNSLDRAPCVVPILSIIDALKHNHSFKTAKRHDFVISQTPQAFCLFFLYQTFKKMFDSSSYNHQLLAQYDDEVALVVASGVEPMEVPGERYNIKITDIDDLLFIQSAISTKYNTLYGIGFDLHKFDNYSKIQQIRIASVDVFHHQSIISHSDGDVVLHALCDALYGVISAGDIGTYFPPSDPKWMNQDSILFLEHALSMLKNKQGKLLHIDCIIIVDVIKITPIRQNLCEALAKLCNISLHQVNIKSKTTENLRFIDVQEAIAAQVLISVRLPSSMNIEDQ